MGNKLDKACKVLSTMPGTLNKPSIHVSCCYYIIFIFIIPCCLGTGDLVEETEARPLP